MITDTVRASWADQAPDWIALEATFDVLFAPVTAAVLQAADIRPGNSVLDVGCGAGTLLAESVGRGATAVGVDVAPDMVEAAARRTPGSTAVLADAQTADLAALHGAPFDRVVSRFGVMFFDDPVAAFANLRAATRSGGRLALACWRGADENPMFTLGQGALDAHRRAHGTAPVDAVEVVDADVAPPAYAPGPLSLADYGRVRTVLRDAGWGDVAVRPLDYVHDHSDAGADGVESRLAVVLGTSQGRRARAELEPLIGPDGWAGVVADVRAEVERFAAGGPVRYAGACWLVTAVAP